ncbi:MAG: hypothetical protein L3J95_03080 [Thermoplasmata archaeon]|nr:hypothetical protein [Thermoplasmata archaeon]MCI4359390.1 hypothetical protein [Thermoplasmata archaeon]
MESRGAGRAPTWCAYAAALVALAAITIVLGPSGLGGPAGSMARVGTGLHLLDSAAGTWDNGVVRLTLTNPLPSFTITSDRDGRVASVHSFERIAEVTPTGNVTAFAPFLTQNVTWRIASAPSGGGEMVWLNATARVSFTHGGWESGDEVSVLDSGPGSTNVSLTFTLNASAAPAPSSVSFDVAVDHWPWTDTRDVLGMEIASVAVPSTTLIPGVAPNSVLEVANGSHQTVATLSWVSSASVAYGSGPGSNSSVVAYRNFSRDASASTVLLRFNATRGGYSELEYDPLVQLNLTAFTHGLLPAWAITPASTEVMAVAVGMVSVLALAAYRGRSRPNRPF